MGKYDLTSKGKRVYLTRSERNRIYESPRQVAWVDTDRELNGTTRPEPVCPVCNEAFAEVKHFSYEIEDNTYKRKQERHHSNHEVTVGYCTSPECDWARVTNAVVVDEEEQAS